MRQLKITKSITNRESQSLDKYLQEIGKVDLITADEEVELARRIKQGDQAALEKLTKLGPNARVADLHEALFDEGIESLRLACTENSSG
jgi:hypothetical protein